MEMPDPSVTAVTEDAPHEPDLVVVIDLSRRLLSAHGAETTLLLDHPFDVGRADAVPIQQMVVA
jgi:hypothetical protein